MNNPDLVPIGIMPEWLWREHRISALLAAILRYEHYYGKHESIAIWTQEVEQHIQFLSANPKRFKDYFAKLQQDDAEGHRYLQQLTQSS